MDKYAEVMAAWEPLLLARFGVKTAAPKVTRAPKAPRPPRVPGKASRPRARQAVEQAATADKPISGDKALKLDSDLKFNLNRAAGIGAGLTAVGAGVGALTADPDERLERAGLGAVAGGSLAALGATPFVVPRAQKALWAAQERLQALGLLK